MTSRRFPAAEAQRVRAPSSRQGWARAAKVALAALAAANAAWVTWYICVLYAGYMHSDSAAKNLLAHEIFATGHYFPPQWNYVNSDLWVLFGHTLIVPLLYIFPDSFALHAASGMICASLILLGIWLAAGVMTARPWARLACAALIGAGLSGVLADNLFGQVSYGMVFGFTCFTMYFAWRFLQDPQPSRWAWAGAFAALTVLTMWANPERAVVSYGIPLIAATIGHAFDARAGGRHALPVRRARDLMAIFLASCVAGLALHVWILKGVHNVGGAATAVWLTFDGMASNLGYTVRGLFALLGGLPTPSRNIASLVSIYEAIRLAAAAVVLAFLPWALVRSLRAASPGLRFAASYTFVLATLLFFLQITTSIPQMVDPIQSSRYLVPALLLMLMLLVAAVASEPLQPYLRMAVTAALLALGTSAYPTYVKSSPANDSRLGTSDTYSGSRVALARFLVDNGLEYGYAGYWNAGVVSVLTGERARVRQIRVAGGLPVPFRHLSSDRWYRPSAWEGETFLLLDPAEAHAVDMGLMEKSVGPPARTLRFEGMTILVYPHNIAGALPGWNP